VPQKEASSLVAAERLQPVVGVDVAKSLADAPTSFQGGADLKKTSAADGWSVARGEANPVESFGFTGLADEQLGARQAGRPLALDSEASKRFAPSVPAVNGVALAYQAVTNASSFLFFGDTNGLAAPTPQLGRGFADTRSSSLTLGAAPQASTANQPVAPAAPPPSSYYYRAKSAQPETAAANAEALLEAKDQFVRTTESGKPVVAGGVAPEPRDGLSQVAVVREQLQAERALRQRYAQDVSRPPARAAGVSGPAANHLATFEVEQTGDRVRVYDADGSVYEGRFLVGQPATDSPARPATAPVQRFRSVEPQANEWQPSRGLAVGEYAKQPSATFLAVGTNRTLKQQVEFRGTMLGAQTPVQLGARFESLQRRDGAAPAQTQALDRLAGGQQAGQAITSTTTPQSSVQQIQMPASRIQGKARIGAATELDIDAVLVNPR
jgi:hypothetical protein